MVRRYVSSARSPGNDRSGHSGLRQAAAPQPQRQPLPAARAVGPQRLDRARGCGTPASRTIAPSKTATTSASKARPSCSRGRSSSSPPASPRPTQADVNQDDFLILDSKDIDVFLGRLTAHLRKISEPSLRNMADCFLLDEELMRKFGPPPAGVKNHHAYQGGLLEHVVTLMDLAVKVADVYPDHRPRPARARRCSCTTWARSMSWLTSGLRLYRRRAAPRPPGDGRRHARQEAARGRASVGRSRAGRAGPAAEAHDRQPPRPDTNSAARSCR